MSLSIPRRSLLSLAVALAGATPTVAHAQQAYAAIFGQVINHRTRAPVQGARIYVEKLLVVEQTSPEGYFEYGGITPGTHAIQVLANDHEPLSFIVEVQPRERAEFVIELKDGAYVLPEIKVEGDRAAPKAKVYAGPLASFERRKDQGRGAFITRKQIEETKVTTLADMLRTVKGVKVFCEVTCVVRMTRAGNCSPAYFLDGFPAGEIDAANLPLLDIAGVEIYRGPSETPGEFQNSESMCGAIAVWTYSGPRKDQDQRPADQKKS